MHRHVESVHAQKKAQRGNRKQRGAGTREHSMNRLGDGLTARIGTEVMGLAEGDAKQARIRAAIKEQSGLVRFSVVVPAAEESSEREAGELGVKAESDVLAPEDVEVDVVAV